MFCYFTFSILDWPGIHTCLITCYIVSLGTAAETVEKLTLRILGCLVGAAAGIAAIVYLMPHVTSVGGLMVVVFLVGAASAWVAGGSPRIAYAGFQMAFAFFLCVIQGSSPEFDLSVARDRIVGILFGNLVVYFLFTTFWPVSVSGRIDPAIGALLRKLSAIIGATERQERWTAATEAAQAVGTLEQDIQLLHYEPNSVRPSGAWIDARRSVAQQAALLASVFLAIADGRLGARMAIRNRLGGLAEFLVKKEATAEAVVPSASIVPVPDSEAHAERSPLSDLVGSALQSLEQGVTTQIQDRRVARHAAA